jgi:PmbA protein
MPPDLAAVVSRVVNATLPGEQIDVLASAGRSTSVRVHNGEVEAFTSAGTAGIGIRVIAEGRVGFAHAGSLAEDVVLETLAAARDNGGFAAPDPHEGLADPDDVEPVAHDQWDEAVLTYPTEEKIRRALELERVALAADPRIHGVRVASWGDAAFRSAFASSAGVLREDRATSCGVGLQPLAADGDESQAGYGSHSGRGPDAVDDARAVREAVERTVRLFGATLPQSGRVTVVLEPRLAATLLGLVSSMLDGEAFTKGRSPFINRIGESVASPLLTLVDDPTRHESLAANTWDGEGLACRANPLITDGVLAGLLHNSLTARRTGVRSTGSALRSARSLPGVGAQVLVVEPRSGDLDSLVAEVDHGLLVAEFQGLHSGVNAVSGDFSVGAPGTMIRGGQLAEPVRGCTIAGSIQRMLADIVAVGADAEWLTGGDFVPTLVIEGVSLAGDSASG